MGEHNAIMSLSFPSSQDQIFERMRTDSQAIVPSLNPGLRESFHRSLLTAFSGMSFEQFLTLEILINEVFIDTATGTFLERWGSYKNVTRNPATQANGPITVSGTATTIVPSGTTFASADGVQYTTQASATILAQSLSVSSITRIANVATTTTASDHNLASGISVTISGADQTEYNGTFTITATALNSFTYEVTGTPVTPATGTILAAFTTASIEVKSVDTGQDKNQLSGIALTVATPIAGMDDTGFVQFDEIGGGTAIESDSDLRIRILDAYQNPFALFNVAQITATAKTVSGVTRVFVQETIPAPGFVTIYFTRDNDSNIIPSASEVTTVKNAILVIKPAFVADSNVIVSAPTPVTTNFTFSSINPNTSTMQTAIIANLDQFFKEKTSVGIPVTEIDYLCAINDTVDTQTGDLLRDFTLTSPTGDIPVPTGNLAVLGTVNF